MIFGILAFITLCISICLKDRKKSLGVQSLSCLLESLYDYTITAYTGAVINVINFIRSFIFINRNKFSKTVYFIILLFFETLIIIQCIFTWGGYISLLPTIGSIIRSFCLWQNNMKLVRISGVTTSLLYGSYYIYYRGWFMVLGFIVLLIFSLYSIYKNDIRKQKN